ncbi:glycosyl hydrolase [Cladochytrium replicatum]|nr:glycosyl hydrolase [Cladochytrium replicatum]
MFIVLASAAAALVLSSHGASCASLDVRTAANNSLFLKWRPSYHFMAPSGWMNDPVAPYYDENTRKYHLFYQHHPEHVKWGNISNSHAVSPNLIVWYDVPNPLVSTDPLKPLAIVTSWVNRNSPDSSLRYDRYGVFSGGAFPNDPSDFSKGFSVVYTSVQELPTGWSIPYKPNTETVSIAETTDRGTTWVKYAGNPVIPSPSDKWNLTGWRDPIPVLEAEEFRQALFPNDPQGTAYALMAGGIKPPHENPGSRLFLYRTLPGGKHLTNWEYAGNLVAGKINESWSPKWSGSFGSNFEMSGAFLLKDEDGKDHWCVSSSSQGDRTDPDPAKGTNWVWWGCGSLKPSADGGKNPSLDSSYLSLEMVGVPDFGEAYAYNTFLAPAYPPNSFKNKRRRILLAWSFEDFTFDPFSLGYQGVHVLPREAYIWSADVLDSAERATEKASWTATKNSDGSYRIKTLGQRPIAETHILRQTACGYWNFAVKAGGLAAGSGYTKLQTFESSSFHLTFTLTPPPLPSDAKASTWKNGVVLRRSPTTSEQTVVYYDAARESVLVDRSASTLLTDFVRTTESAPLRLWTLKSTGSRQPLEFTVFADNSIIEIYVNDVLTLTTRVYPLADDAFEVGAWMSGGDARFLKFDAFDLAGVQAFPERKKDTSLPLVWDGGEVAGLWDGY